MADQDITAACRQCGFAASRNYCAECGAPLQPAGRIARSSRAVLAPLYEYAEHARAILAPARLVEEIRAHRFGWPELIGFWLAAAALAALANAVFDQPSFTGVSLPILDEIADALAAMVALVLLYSPLHPLLGRRGGARYGEFVVTLLAIGALIYPWITLARGALAAAGMAEAGQLVTLAAMLFFIRAFAALYGRSAGKVVAWMLGYFLVLGTVLALAVAPFADKV